MNKYLMLIVTLLVFNQALAQPCQPEPMIDKEAYGPFTTYTYFLGNTAARMQACQGLVFEAESFNQAVITWSSNVPQAVLYRMKASEWTAWKLLSLTGDDTELGRSGLTDLNSLESYSAIELLPQDPTLLTYLNVELRQYSLTELNYNPRNYFLRYSASGWALWRLEEGAGEQLELSANPDDLFYDLLVNSEEGVAAVLKVAADQACMPCNVQAIVIDLASSDIIARQDLPSAEGALVWYDRLVYELSVTAQETKLIDIEY